jgi:hypothetical protein
VTRIAVALALAALLLLARSAHADTPVPPIACGIPGWPPCFHYVYMPMVEVRR